MFKLFSFPRYFNFCPDFLTIISKRFDKKANFGFKVNDVKDWITNNYNTHFSQYLKKLGQSVDIIWSGYRI